MKSNLLSKAKKFAEIVIGENQLSPIHGRYASAKIQKNPVSEEGLNQESKEFIDLISAQNSLRSLTVGRNSADDIFSLEEEGEKIIVRGIPRIEAVQALQKLQKIKGHENYIIDYKVFSLENKEPKEQSLSGYLVGESLPYGNLKAHFDKIENKEERQKEIKKWLPKIIELIDFLHKNNIAFPDLKLSNLFFDKNMKKVIIADPKSLTILNINHGEIILFEAGCSRQYLPKELQTVKALRHERHSYKSIISHLLEQVVLEMLIPNFQPNNATEDECKEAEKLINEAKTPLAHYNTHRTILDSQIKKETLLDKLMSEFDDIFNEITESTTINPEKEKSGERFCQKVELHKENIPQYRETLSEIQHLLDLKLDILIDQEKENLRKFYPRGEYDNLLSKNINRFVDRCEIDQSSATVSEKEEILRELNDTRKIFSPGDVSAPINFTEVLRNTKSYDEKYKNSPRTPEMRNIAKDILNIIGGLALIAISVPCLAAAGLGILGIAKGASLVKQGVEGKSSQTSLVGMFAHSNRPTQVSTSQVTFCA